MTITEEQIQRNKEVIIKLLRKTERPNIEDMIKKLEESDYFTAPASTMYHLSCKGGLAYHSLMVCKTLKQLSETYKVPIPEDTLIIAGILHDVCKVNKYHFVHGRYKTIFGTSNDHGLLSIQRIKKSIELTEQEEMMIRWHMARYTWDGKFDEVEDKLKNEFPEVYLMYFADHISTLFVEEK